MTIERDHQHSVIIVCDVGTCPNKFTLHDQNFTITWNAAKRDGWEAKKIAGTWLHACPECMI